MGVCVCVCVCVCVLAVPPLLGEPTIGHYSRSPTLSPVYSKFILKTLHSPPALFVT